MAVPSKLYDNSPALLITHRVFTPGFPIADLLLESEEDSGGDVIYVSFNGTEDHFKIRPGATLALDKEYFGQLQGVGELTEFPATVWVRSNPAGAAYNMTLTGK